MEKEIVESEGHYDLKSLQGLKLARDFLQDLMCSSNRGLLEHEIIITINSKLLTLSRKMYSQSQRMTTFRGHMKIYCDPQEINSKMQIIIDRFNEKCFYQKTIHEALAEFVIDFLDIHPFSDGNGRTIKLIIWYVLKSFQKLKRFYCLSYPIWCDIVFQKSHKLLITWFHDMQ